jgi:hypothetical protein
VYNNVGQASKDKAGAHPRHTSPHLSGRLELAPIIESRCPFLTVAGSLLFSMEAFGVANNAGATFLDCSTRCHGVALTFIVSSGQAPPGLSKTRAKAFSASDVVLGLPGSCCTGVDDSVMPLWEALFILWHTWQSPTGGMARSSKIQYLHGRVEGEVVVLGGSEDQALLARERVRLGEVGRNTNMDVHNTYIVAEME